MGDWILLPQEEESKGCVHWKAKERPTGFLRPSCLSVFTSFNHYRLGSERPTGWRSRQHRSQLSELPAHTDPSSPFRSSERITHHPGSRTSVPSLWNPSKPWTKLAATQMSDNCALVKSFGSICTMEYHASF